MKNFKGNERRVGFEIEFQNLSPKTTAELVAKITDGKVSRISDASYKVESNAGDFICETDAKLLKELAKSSDQNIKIDKFDFEGVVKDILGPLTKELVPTEIVSPPLVESNFSIISKIEAALLENGAKGTNESAHFAFAAQFNPEIEKNESDYILNVLRSYILLTDWLRSQIYIDFSRKLTSYIDDFPKKYALKVLQSDYTPSLEQLIDDYLEFNPTRNRGLDFLPLFLFLDEKRVRKVVKDERVKSRPTFHYRLPSCQIGLESWHIFIEWKRWLLLEKLAKDTSYLDKMTQAYLKLNDSTSLNFGQKWLNECNHFIEDFR